MRLPEEAEHPFAELDRNAANTAVVDHLDTGFADSRVLSDTDQVKLQKCMTIFGDRIPHHGVENFGERIVVSKGIQIPVYKLVLQTLFENREVVRKKKPYRGESIPPLLVSEPNIDVWSYECNAPDDFRESIQESLIEESQTVFDCPRCNASGKLGCNDCHGNGSLSCKKCEGSGKNKCRTCSGTTVLEKWRPTGQQRTEHCTWCKAGRQDFGRIICPKCNGTALVFKDVMESYLVSCHNCEEGMVACGRCSATGKIGCKTCLSSGKVVCPECEGNQKVVSFLSLIRSYNPSATTSFVPCSPVPDEILLCLDQPDCYRSILNHTTREFPVLAESLLNRKIDVPIVTKELREQVKVSKSIAVENKRISKQCLEVFQAEVLYIHYKYKGNDYEVWLYGNKGDGYAVKSPFSEVVQVKMGEALTAWEAGQRAMAADLLRQCWDMGKKTPHCQVVVDSMKDRVPGSLRALAIANTTVKMMKSMVASATAIFVMSERGIRPFWVGFSIWLFFPLGLFLLWKHPTLSRRWSWWVVGGIWSLALVLGLISDKNKKASELADARAHQTKQSEESGGETDSHTFVRVTSDGRVKRVQYRGEKVPDAVGEISISPFADNDNMPWYSLSLANTPDSYVLGADGTEKIMFIVNLKTSAKFGAGSGCVLYFGDVNVEGHFVVIREKGMVNCMFKTDQKRLNSIAQYVGPVTVSCEVISVPKMFVFNMNPVLQKSMMRFRHLLQNKLIPADGSVVSP